MHWVITTLNFAPAILIGGFRVPEILLTKEDWQSLLEFQGVLLEYLHGSASRGDPISIADINIYFWEKVWKLKIPAEHSSLSARLWKPYNKKSHMNSRLDELDRKQFDEFYTGRINRIKHLPSDTKSNLDPGLQQIHADDKNVRVMFWSRR